MVLGGKTGNNAKPLVKLGRLEKSRKIQRKAGRGTLVKTMLNATLGRVVTVGGVG